jgi:hypothetical protein
MRSFEELIVECANAACMDWRYPPLPGDWLATVTSRLPGGLRHAVAMAVDDGIIQIVEGHRFALSGLGSTKGPYAFFSRSAREVPAPNWEYFVQAAEYGRVTRAVNSRMLRVAFEDDLMDVSVYEADRVVWCIEVKERAHDLEPLLVGMRSGSAQVDMNTPDRHNDALRKSKYLMRHKPPYFSLVAIGRRLDFSVTYQGAGFTLTEDLVPIA